MIYKKSLKRVLNITSTKINHFHTTQHHGNRSLNLSHTIYNPPSETTSIGTGLPFLITHGLLGSKNNWNSIAKAVAKVTNRMVVVFDARNHGDSPHISEHSYPVMAKDILNLANDLKIDKLSLMGHSMGGRSAMVLALEAPQRLEKLVVVDVSPISMQSEFHSSMKVYIETMLNIKFGSENDKLTLSEARKIANNALRPVISSSAVRAFLITNLAESNGQIIWKPNLPVLLEAVNSNVIGDFPQELKTQSFKEETLFIRGEKSTYIPLEDFEGIKKLFPNASFDTITNAGHWPHADNSKDFLTSLISFLKS